jgi:integrase
MERFAGAAADALVFPSADGGVLKLALFRGHTWVPALSTAGISPAFRIHDMRHTAASMLINQGLHPKIVQDHLGARLGLSHNRPLRAPIRN